jgi:hypothetical protein
VTCNQGERGGFLHNDVFAGYCGKAEIIPYPL